MARPQPQRSVPTLLVRPSARWPRPAALSRSLFARIYKLGPGKRSPLSSSWAAAERPAGPRSAKPRHAPSPLRTGAQSTYMSAGRGPDARLAAGAAPGCRRPSSSRRARARRTAGSAAPPARSVRCAHRARAAPALAGARAAGGRGRNSRQCPHCPARRIPGSLAPSAPGPRLTFLPAAPPELCRPGSRDVWVAAARRRRNRNRSAAGGRLAQAGAEPARRLPPPAAAASRARRPARSSAAPVRPRRPRAGRLAGQHLTHSPPDFSSWPFAGLSSLTSCSVIGNWPPLASLSLETA